MVAVVQSACPPPRGKVHTHTHSIAMCTCRRAYVYTDLPTMYMYVHTDAHVYAQTHLHTIHSNTEIHERVRVLMCVHRPTFTLYKHTQRHPFRAPHRQQTQTLMCIHRLTFILSIQTQRHMSVYVCSCVYTDPPSHYTNTLRSTHLELLTGNRHSETSFSFTFGLTTQAPLSTHTGISENSPARNGKDSAAGPHPLHLPEPTALGRPLRAPL